MKKLPSNLRRQAGLTLIELSVVLLILIGLAGLMLPYVSGYLAKTHQTTNVATTADLDLAIQRYQNLKWALPNNLESLYDTTAAAIYSKLANNAMLTADTTAADITQAKAALALAGITTVYNNNNSTTDATFQSTTGAAAAPTALIKLTGTTAADPFFGQIATPSASAVKNQLMYAFGGDANTYDTTCTNYWVLGIGTNNSMIPSVMQAAPVHFAGTAAGQPATTYSRYLAVIATPVAYAGASVAVDDVTGATCNSESGNAATFVGVAQIFPNFPAIVGLNGAQEYTAENMKN